MADIVAVAGQWVQPINAGLHERWHHPCSHDITTTSTTQEYLGASDGRLATLGGAKKDINLNNDQGEKDEWSITGTNPEALKDLDVKLVDADIGKVLNAFINAQDNENIETHDHIISCSVERGHDETDCADESDEEEEIELEFERGIKKLDTHTMHCPRCHTQVTKVILRRKRRSVARNQHEALSLLGCLPCLSVFVPNGNFFNMFGLLGNQTKKSQQTPASDEIISTLGENTSSSIISSDSRNLVIREKEGCFGLFEIFLNKKDIDSTENLRQTSTIDINGDSSPTYVNGDKGDEQEKDQGQHPKGKVVAETEKSSYYPYARLRRYFGFHSPQVARLPAEEVRIDIRDDSDMLETMLLAKQDNETEEKQNAIAGKLERGYRNQDGGVLGGQHTCPRAETTNLSSDQDAKGNEILKSIVYGGILESIKSPSLVAAAAASGATTTNITALALVNLICGLFTIGHNLWYLKEEDSNHEAIRYQKLLGRRENFPLHATFAVLAFLIFGLIPPVTYGFLIPESDSLAFKMVAVGAASLVCVFILAIGKAYAQRTPEFSSYIKTITYYVGIGIVVSVASFVGGHLIKELIEEFGLSDANSPANVTLPAMTSAIQ